MHNYLLCCLLLAPGLTFAQTASGQTTPFAFTLKGKVGQLSAPAKIYLVRGMEITDSTTLKNGNFELKGTSDVPQEARLVIRPKGKMKNVYGLSSNQTGLFLEPGTVTVTSPDSLPNATLAGSRLTADFNKLQASLKPIGAKMNAFGAEARRASPEQQQSPAFRKRMQESFMATGKEYEKGYAAFATANPTSWVSLDVLKYIGGGIPKYAELAPPYAALSPALKATPQGRKYDKLLQALKAVAVGAVAPNITQKTPEGRTVSLADYRGKYVLVDFWASWCGPCRQENPNVTKAYNAYKGRNFDILSVSLDTEQQRAKWVKAIQEDQLAWTQVSDLGGFEGEAATRYQVRAIPQNFLIDPNGKIVAANLRGEELQTTLAKFIK